MKLPGLALVAALMLAAGGPLAAQEGKPGWRRVEVPATGSYFWRYVPFGLDRSAPAPVILFLHGAGGSPEGYSGGLREAAERARAVVALPKSTTNLGWGLGADEQTVDEALRLVAEEVPVDRRRVSIAGHSAGGAYAYLLAYPRVSRYSAVFTLAASLYPVTAVADAAYTAPIRMYYGTLDPNYTGGAYSGLKAQWSRLGVPWQEDVQPGYEHGSWPAGSMVDGFLFLVAQSYPAAAGGLCVPAPTVLCLGGGRFRAEVAWRDFADGTGPGRVVPGAADGSGIFWFFSPDNWELMVKVIDGCALNGHFWVFSAATTSVEYELVVTDTATGESVRYPNAAGQPAPANTDTGAFTCSQP